MASRVGLDNACNAAAAALNFADTAAA
jgi:hypothetical protein